MRSNSRKPGEDESYQVTLAMAENAPLNAGYRVIRIADNGTGETLNAHRNAKGNLIFEADGFGTFVVAVREHPSLWMSMLSIAGIGGLLMAVPFLRRLIRRKKGYE